MATKTPDGQTDFEVEHGSNSSGEDFLALQKNDALDVALPPGTDDAHEYLTPVTGDYITSLGLGEQIGPASSHWEFVNTNNYDDTFTTRRANRLIDYDSGVDETGPWNPPAVDGYFDGNEGVVQYIGARVDLANGHMPR